METRGDEGGGEEEGNAKTVRYLRYLAERTSRARLVRQKVCERRVGREA